MQAECLKNCPLSLGFKEMRSVMSYKQGYFVVLSSTAPYQWVNEYFDAIFHEILHNPFNQLLVLEPETFDSFFESRK